MISSHQKVLDIMVQIGATLQMKSVLKKMNSLSKPESSISSETAGYLTILLLEG